MLGKIKGYQEGQERARKRSGGGAIIGKIKGYQEGQGKGKKKVKTGTKTSSQDFKTVKQLLENRPRQFFLIGPWKVSPRILIGLLLN